MINLDFFLFQKIHQWAGRFFYLDKIAIFFARDFIYLLFFLGLIYLFFIYQKKLKNFLPLILAIVFSRLVIVELIRWLYYRPRPFLEWSFTPLISHSLSGSFPSGHLAFFFPLAMFIYFSNKKLGLVFIISAFFIGWGRIFVGLHYPLDIFAGILIGFFSTLIFKRIKIKF